MTPNELHLTKEIYSKNAIYRAIEDYQTISKIDINENDNYYICFFNTRIVFYGN